MVVLQRQFQKSSGSQISMLPKQAGRLPAHQHPTVINNYCPCSLLLTCQLRSLPPMTLGLFESLSSGLLGQWCRANVRGKGALSVFLHSCGRGHRYCEDLAARRVRLWSMLPEDVDTSVHLCCCSCSYRPLPACPPPCADPVIRSSQRKIHSGYSAT